MWSDEALEARRQKKAAQFNKLMPIEDFALIGCGQCRRCEVVPETDVSAYRNSEPVLIFCGKSCAIRPALFEDCPNADPRPALPSHLRGLSNHIGVGNTHRGEFVRDLGDCSPKLTEFMLLILHEFWVEMPATWLCRVSGRQYDYLREAARKYGFGGERAKRTRKHFGKRPSFTAAQTEYLEGYYKHPSWPGGHISKKYPAKGQALLERRQCLIEKTAELGPRWDWVQIVRYLGNRRTQQAHARQAARMAQTR